MDPTNVSDLRRWLGDLAVQYDVPGVSLSVLAGGRVTDAAAGVVNLRTGVDARPDSPFMIQSITKVWTATLVMQLVDEGLVDPDEPVVRHLPGFRTADPAASSEITVRHLLTHTGGFEGDIWAPTTADDDALALFVDQHVAVAAQHLPPGSLYSYCSAGMGVLGRLVEVHCGTTYAAALHRHLVEPLGVEAVAVDADQALGFRTAIGHVRRRPGEPLVPTRGWAVMPPSNPAAGNQLAMPARGLVELARMHLSDGVGPTGARLLSATSARSMRTGQVAVPATGDPDVRQGLGWRLPSSRVVEHGGGAPGAGAALHLVPDSQVAVAVLANGGDMGGLISEVLERLLGELADVSPSPGPATPPAERVEGADRLCGRYELRNQVFDVVVDGAGRLWLTTEERNDAATMAARAGVDLAPETTELRRLTGGRFLRVDDAGRGTGVVEFLGTDGSGRAPLLHTGRAAPRSAPGRVLP